MRSGTIFVPGKKTLLLHAEEVVARGSCGPSISFNKGVNPVEPPQCEGCEVRWVLNNRPIFVNEGRHPIHHVWDFFEVWRNVLPNINRIFAITSAKCRD